MDFISKRRNFNDVYKELTSALERESLSSSITEISRLVLQINDLANCDAEKIQLNNLTQRVEKLRLDAPESKKIRDVLEIWKCYSSEAFDLTAKLLSIFRGVLSNYQRATVARWMEKIPIDRRPDMIKKIRSVFDEIKKESDRGRIFNLLERIPEESKLDVIEKAIPLLEGVDNVLEKSDILVTISKISTGSRSDVIEKAMPFLQGITNGYHKVTILLTIEGISAESRSDVIEKAMPLLEGITDGHSISTILSTIAEIREELRPYVIHKTLSISKGIESVSYKTSVLHSIGKILSEEGSDVLEKVLPLIKDLEYSEGRKQFLLAVEKIPAGQRADIIEKALPVFKGLTNVFSGKKLFRALVKIPEEEREDVWEKALSVFDGISDEDEREFILSTIKEIPPEYRTPGVIRAIPALVRGLKSGGEGEYIFEAVQSVPPEQRGEVIEKTLPYLANVTSGYVRSLILKTVGEVPRERRSLTAIHSIANSIVLLYEGVVHGLEKVELGMAIEEISPEHKVAILENVCRLIDGMSGGGDRTKLLRIVKKIPSEFRSEAVDFAKDFKSLEKEILLEFIVQLPPKSRRETWKNFLIQLDKIHDPLLQRKSLFVCRQALQDPAIVELFESQKMDELFSTAHSQVYRLFVACLWRYSNVDESLYDAASVLNSKQSKDVSRKKVIVNAFITLFQAKSLEWLEKVNLLGIVFSKHLNQNVAVTKQSIEEIEKSLLLTETICRFGCFDELREIGKVEELSPLLEAILKSRLGLRGISGFSDRYLETFGSFRDPASLSVYMGKAESLSQPEKTEVLKALTLYVDEVLKGTFFSSRYEESSSPHLLKVFENGKELKRRWREGKKIDFEEMFPGKAALDSSSVFDAKEYIKQRVVTDKHISHDKIPYLVDFLQKGESRSVELVEEIKKRAKEISVDPKNRRLQGDYGLLKLQKGLLSLLQEKSDTSYEIFRSNVEPFMAAALAEEAQFASDLIGLGKMLTPRIKENSFLGWTVVDTDDPEDLLVCGTEVEGSCQNIHGGPMNKCLPAYALDGKNRLIAVKDGKGRIIARSILRILWDEKTQIPVLFKERVYLSSRANAKASEAIDRMSLLRARELQLPLVAQTTPDSRSVPYPNALKSLGSRAPFEYTDAGGGPTRGEFEVRGVLLT